MSSHVTTMSSQPASNNSGNSEHEFVDAVDKMLDQELALEEVYARIPREDLELNPIQKLVGLVSAILRRPRRTAHKLP